MTTPPLITGAFAQVLRSGREQFNARFAEAKRQRSALDPADFGDYLRLVVAPIVEAVHRARPEKTAEATQILYDLSLDLLGQELVGAKSRYPFIGEGWRNLLPLLARHIAASPRQVVGAVTNALYNISLTPGARPAEWIESMRMLAPLCDDAARAEPDEVATLMRAGQVAAWRAGLAHYRQSALDVCRQLPAPIALAALGASEAASRLTLGELLARLAEDPWLKPSDIAETDGNPVPQGNPVPRAFARRQAKPAAQGKRELRIVARVGAFRGFGGLFMSPPTVALSGEHFVVRDGDSRWLLTADAFGATFHRADAPPLPVGEALGVRESPQATGSGAFQVDRSGRVTHSQYSQTFPEVADFTSAAGNGVTLAATTALSHAVYLIALAS